MFKRFYIPLILIGVCLLTVSNASAQVTPGGTGSPAYDIKAGGGFAYGSEIEKLGLQLNGYYRLPANEQIFVGADFTYYFPETETAFGVEEKITWIEININGQYHFLQEEELGVYGLGGLNYTSLSFSVEADGFDSSASESEIGLNIGGGVEYNLDFGLVYGELKFVISDADQLVFGAGVRIPFGMN